MKFKTELSMNLFWKVKELEKNIIPFNIIHIYTKLEILLGLKLSGHTDTLTEASNLVDELYTRGEIQNEQQYRNAPNDFHTQEVELPSKVLEQIAFITGPKIEEHMIKVIKKNLLMKSTYLNNCKLKMNYLK